MHREEEFTINWERGEEGVNGSKLVKFAENGKEYRVIVTIDWLRKGWFKDRVTFGSFHLPPDSSFLIFEENIGVKEFSQISFGKGLRQIKPLYWRWAGPSIIAVVSFLVFSVLVVFAKWKKEDKIYVRKTSWTKVIKFLAFVVIITAILLFLAEKYE